MRIKEVEKQTGLTAKAIRLYESKGLLKPARETENDYRDYTEEDVARLKTIAILRKLDIPVKVIKDWTDGKTPLEEILRKAADQNREASRESELRRELAEDLADLLEKDPDVDLGEAVSDLEEINEIIAELEELLKEAEGHVGMPLYSTLLALGPILMAVIYIQEGIPGKALFSLALSIPAVAFATLRWRDYFATPKAKRKSEGCLTMVVLFAGGLAAAFVIFFWIQEIQKDLFVRSDTDVCLYRLELLPLFFLIELIMGFLWVMEKPWQKKPWKRKTVAIALAAILTVNAVVLQAAVMSVSVATEAGITRYSFFCPNGKLTPYTDVERIDTGFKGKTLGLPMQGTGEFYYKITYTDGRTENWGKAICHGEEISWSFILRFDEWVRSGGAEKHGSEKNWEYCDFDDVYVDIFRRVVGN